MKMFQSLQKAKEFINQEAENYTRHLLSLSVLGNS